MHPGGRHSECKGRSKLECLKSRRSVVGKVGSRLLSGRVCELGSEAEVLVKL